MLLNYYRHRDRARQRLYYNPRDFRSVTERICGETGGRVDECCSRRPLGTGTAVAAGQRRADDRSRSGRPEQRRPSRPVRVRRGRDELRGRGRLRLDGTARAELAVRHTPVVHAPQIGHGQAVGVPAARIPGTSQGQTAGPAPRDERAAAATVLGGRRDGGQAASQQQQPEDQVLVPVHRGSGCAAGSRVVAGQSDRGRSRSRRRP